MTHLDHDDIDPTAELDRVRAEIARLQTELAALTRQVEVAARPAATDVSPATSSRRGLLKLAGATAAGVVASTAITARAAADTGYSTGGSTTVGDVVRQQLNGSRSDEVGFLFATVSSPLLANNEDGDGAALGGLAIDGVTAIGVKGRSTLSNGTGVFGDGSGSGATGVRGDGLWGVAGNGRGVGGTGVVGIAGPGAEGGVLGMGNDYGVRGSSGAASGVGVNGRASSQGGIGVDGFGGRYGARLQGATAALRLVDNGGDAPPATATAHQAGELVFADGGLWVCVKAGSPGTWREIAGLATAGSFHPLSGGRVYDSREAQPLPGAISGGQNRTISVAAAREVAGGAVVIPDYVPAGARAIAANVTVVSVSGAGFLACNPGGVTTVTASTINWSAPGQVLANGVILSVTGRELTVVAGGGSAHFVVDVTGYWL